MTLPGPSKTIVVEPLEQPAEPAPEPSERPAEEPAQPAEATAR